MNKELVRQAIDKFGNLLPRYQKVSNHVFSHLIYMNHTLSNPITKKLYDEINKDSELLFIRHYNQITVKKV
jgi:hypothetical protein